MGNDDPTDEAKSGLEEAATLPAFDPVAPTEASAEVGKTGRGPAPGSGQRSKPPSGSGSGGLADASVATLSLEGGLDEGARVGRFTIIQRLGEGGMGVVLAAYDPLLDRKVAIKVMRPQSSGTGLAGQARRRLLREAQAMAKLSHPNVLPVFDAAEIGDQVCIAMEFVDGSTLRHWVRAAKRSWREILGVYILAGRGLAAAHEAGLIHRDFKPDNVLIDAKGRVRVTDFGLVAAVASTMAEAGSTSEAAPPSASGLDDSGSALAMSLTSTGDVMGTPNYMAPEQHCGGSTDARTDQFGFCVALYEALYGERPFAGLTYRQVADRVLGGEISEPPPDAEVPSWLREILLRGLSTARDDRYPSMDALLEALARDPAAQRRRRLQIASIAALIAALAGSLVFVVARDGRRAGSVCSGAERELAGVWDQRVRKQVAVAFSATGLSYADATYARVAAMLDEYTQAWVAMRREACEATRVHGTQSDSMLDLRMNCLDRRLTELRALTALFAAASDRELLDHALGAVSSAVAIETCGDTHALAAAVPPPEDSALRERVAALRVRLAEANAQRVAGRYRRGVEIAEEVVASAREIGYAPLLAEALSILGMLQYRSQDAKTAERTLREGAQVAARSKNDDLAANTWLALMMVLSTGQRRPEAAMEIRPFAEAALARAGDKPIARADYLRELGNVLLALGKASEANQHHLQALALAERVFPPGHTSLGSYYNDLGASLMGLGKPTEALEQFQRVLDIETASFGEYHPFVALTLTNMAVVHGGLGDREKAIELQKRALELSIRVHGPEHAIVADMQERVGNFLAWAERVDEATPYYERAIEILRRQPGASDPKLARAYAGLGDVFWMKAELARAREKYAHAVTVAERAYGADHAETARLVRAIGLIDRERRAFDSAIEQHRRALGIRRRTLGPDHVDVAESLFDIGDVLRASGRLDEARDYYDQALAMEEQLLGPAHSELASSLNSMGELLRAQGKYSDAKRFYERALAMRERLSGPSDASLASPLNNLGEVACAEKRFGDARDYCRRALALEEKVHGANAPGLAYALTCLGRAELGLDNPTGAVEHLERALALRADGRDDPLELASTRLNLARALWESGGDRGRASSLVQEVREAHAAAPFVPHQLKAELAAWQRAHR